MIDINRISAESALLDEQTKETIKGVLAKLNRDAVLKAVVDLEEEKSVEMASFLRGIAELSPRISVEFYEPSESGNLGMDTEHLPATGFFLDGNYTGVAFHGVPGGKEINSFVIGLYNLVGPGQEISKGAVKKIGKLKRAAKVRICVSLACHHCPGVVIAAQRIAMLSPLVEAEMYDANLYPDMVEQYKIERVPLVVINDKETFAGPRSIEDLAQLLMDAK